MVTKGSYECTTRTLRARTVYTTAHSYCNHIVLVIALKRLRSMWPLSPTVRLQTVPCCHCQQLTIKLSSQRKLRQ